MSGDALGQPTLVGQTSLSRQALRTKDQSIGFPVGTREIHTGHQLVTHSDPIERAVARALEMCDLRGFKPYDLTKRRAAATRVVAMLPLLMQRVAVEVGWHFELPTIVVGSVRDLIPAIVRYELPELIGTTDELDHVLDQLILSTAQDAGRQQRGEKASQLLVNLEGLEEVRRLLPEPLWGVYMARVLIHEVTHIAQFSIPEFRQHVDNSAARCREISLQARHAGSDRLRNRLLHSPEIARFQEEIAFYEGHAEFVTRRALASIGQAGEMEAIDLLIGLPQQYTVGLQLCLDLETAFGSKVIASAIADPNLWPSCGGMLNAGAWEPSNLTAAIATTGQQSERGGMTI